MCFDFFYIIIIFSSTKSHEVKSITMNSLFSLYANHVRNLDAIFSVFDMVLSVSHFICELLVNQSKVIYGTANICGKNLTLILTNRRCCVFWTKRIVREKESRIKANETNCNQSSFAIKITLVIAIHAN